VGRIKSYTGFARAIDGTGQVESDFEKGRNMNTFEVKEAKGARSAKPPSRS
jgi:hypothetical protein